MKKVFPSLFICLFSITTFIADAQTENNLGIIPAPVSVERNKGSFVLNDKTVIVTDNPNDKAVVFFIHYLKQHHLDNKIMRISDLKKIRERCIVFNSNGAGVLPDEGYKLTISPKQIMVFGKDAGMFYAVQTLLQLLPVDTNIVAASVPCAAIMDYPRFRYRGMHLDVSRHFFPVSFIKDYLDLMASYKLNNFHWHLTDDQGWRIEIKRYPKLTAIGGQAPKTNTALYDRSMSGGYYTQDEIREIVKYAADRYINIVPEIEMPGHSQAAVAAYPQMSCDSTKVYQVGGSWGVFNDVFCPSETTFTMLDNILLEVMDLFPGKYIHIGGDECPKEPWKNSAFCQELMKKEGLKDEDALQSYFIQRIEKFVNAHGKSIIGWDEILEGGLAPNATVMSWRGEEGGIAAAQQDHDVIMTPGSNGLYFDHAQSRSPQEPRAIGGYAPYQKTYSYDPVPASLTSQQKKHVIGVQANMWTEYIATPAKVEYMLLPRMLALSEIAWSQTENKNLKDFSETRLPHDLARLDSMGYEYRVPVAIGADDTTVTMKGGAFNISLKPSVEGATIYYTLDGYAPREIDLPFTSPMNIIVPIGKKRELQTIVITPSGKRSIVSKMILDNTYTN